MFVETLGPVLIVILTLASGSQGRLHGDWLFPNGKISIDELVDTNCGH